MTRDKHGRWTPGTSPNPQGRKPGSGKVAALRASITDAVPEIVARLIEAAKAGDIGAARLLIERAIPTVRPVELPAQIAFTGSSLSDQGRSVLAAVGDGAIGPGQGAQLLAALADLGKLIETDELEERICEIERRLADDTDEARQL